MRLGARPLPLLAALCASARGDFSNGDAIMDTSGQRVRAHQPHVYKFGGKYYLYGSDHVDKSDGTPGAVNVYTSSDCYTWKFVRIAFQGGGFVARPSIIGPKNGNYVLWTAGGNPGWQVATASSPAGPFKKVGNVPPPSGKSGDSQAFAHGGSAFIVYTDTDAGYTIHTMKLNDDWTGLASGEKPFQALGQHSLEAPCPFYTSVTKSYFIWCSHTSGWDPNAAFAMTSGGGMRSPFKSLNPSNPSGSKTTFGTQGSHILPLSVVGGVQRLLYMGDRYVPYHAQKEGSRYIFLPMEVHSNGKVTLSNQQKWSLNKWPSAAEFTTVAWANASNVSVSA